MSPSTNPQTKKQEADMFTLDTLTFTIPLLVFIIIYLTQTHEGN